MTKYGNIWIIQAFDFRLNKWFNCLDNIEDGKHGLFFWSKKEAKIYRDIKKQDNSNMKLRIVSFQRQN